MIAKRANVQIVTGKNNSLILKDEHSTSRVTPTEIRISRGKKIYSFSALWLGNFEVINRSRKQGFNNRKKAVIRNNGIELIIKPTYRIKGIKKLSNILMKPFTTKLFNLGWEITFNKSRNIIAVCEYLAKEAKKELGREVSVCPIGIDQKDFVASKKLPLKHPSVCMIQNHQIRQKSEALLEFSKVIEELPQVNFYISKGLSENLNNKNTEKVIKKLAGIKNVKLADITSENKYDYLSACDLYVLATGLDCTPATILEAGLAGKPILASAVGGVPEMIVDGKMGWAIPNEDKKLWINKITEILNDKKKLEAMGKFSREHIIKNYEVGVVAKKLYDFFLESESS